MYVDVTSTNMVKEKTTKGLSTYFLGSTFLTAGNKFISKSAKDDFKIPLWILFVVAAVLVFAFVVGIILCKYKQSISKTCLKRKVQSTGETTYRLQQPDVGLTVHPTAQYEEIDLCGEMVNNTLYEQNRTSSRPDYDHLYLER